MHTPFVCGIVLVEPGDQPDVLCAGKRMCKTHPFSVLYYKQKLILKEESVVFNDWKSLIEKNAKRNGDIVAEPINEVEVIFVDMATTIKDGKATVVAVETGRKIKIDKMHIDRSTVTVTDKYPHGTHNDE